MRKIKDRVDVTLEDVLRLGGSRWKALLMSGGIDLKKFTDDLSTFLNDIPEFRKVRAYAVLDGDDGQLHPDMSKHSTIDFLYTRYSELSDIQEAITLSRTKTVSAGHVDIDLPKFSVENSEHLSLRNTNESLANKVDAARNRIGLLTNDISNIIDNVTDYKTSITDNLRKLESIDSTVEIDVGKYVNNIIANSQELGMYPLNIFISVSPTTSRPLINFDFIAEPRLMYDMSNPHRKPVLTQPILFTMRATDSSGYSLTVKDSPRTHNRYSSCHPHVGREFICWGELSDEYSDASSSYDAVEVMSVLDRLLRAYNSGSPFCTWTEYIRSVGYSSLCTLNSTDKVNSAMHFVGGVLNGVRSTNRDADMIVFMPVKFTMDDILGEELCDSLRKSCYITELSYRSDNNRLNALEDGSAIMIGKDKGLVVSGYHISNLAYTMTRDEYVKFLEKSIEARTSDEFTYYDNLLELTFNNTHCKVVDLTKVEAGALHQEDSDNEEEN